jgi:ABC-type transporter Mla maintaining outer membrane lipid asymmetry ATPase subunit MlaF
LNYLRVAGLSKTFGKTTVLDRIDLDVAEGELSRCWVPAVAANRRYCVASPD